MVAADGSRLLPDSCTRHGCIEISSLLGRRWIGFLDGFQWEGGRWRVVRLSKLSRHDVRGRKGSND